MSFNARISLALNLDPGSKDEHYVIDQLNKMLRQRRNLEYQDQIYYALGNIQLKDGNEKEAIELFKKSVKSSVSNITQKSLSCITLADIYYNQHKFIDAEAFYDTAMLHISTSYPNYTELKERTQNLNRLVNYLNTISLEDSLQRVAKMSPADRSKLIDKIINDVKQKEAEEKLLAQQRLQDYYNNLQNRGTGGGQQGKWYFYNPSSVIQGIKDFQAKWGNRRLEDDWRRRTKGSTGQDEENADSTATAKAPTPETDKKKITDNKKPEYYLQVCP